MPEVETAVTLKGNPVTLSGKSPKIGDPAPNVTLVANDLSTVELSSFKGKKIIISATPSLDTPICDLQAKRFNKEAATLGSDVVVINVSTDLPFAQKRWCGATGSDKIKTLSDHREAAFGESYGILIKNLRILGRAIYIINKEGKLAYKQIVPEITTEPNYDDVLKAVKNI
jgi:thiol peroxidase